MSKATGSSHSRKPRKRPVRRSPAKPKVKAKGKRGRGRPPKSVSPNQVERLAGIGCTQEEIGVVLGVSVDTLARNYAEPLKRGSATLNVSLRRLQLNKAKRGNIVMMIWLGKQLLGQSDKREVSGGIQVRDMEALRKKRWKAAGAALVAASGDGGSDEP